MAAPRTLLTLEDVEPLCAQYPVRPRGLRPLSGGTVNSNYVLDTSDGPLFLRVNEGKAEEDARFEAELIWHLGKGGVATPQLWRTRRGAPYVMLPSMDGEPRKPLMLMGWAAGVDLPEERITAAAARSVGAALGRLHLAAADFPLRRGGIYTLPHILGRIRRLHAEPRVPDGIVEFLEREGARLSGARSGGLPVGLGHGDLFPDNVLFRRPDGPALDWVLDFEQAATLPYAYDVAVSLLSFCAAPPALLSAAGAAEEPERLGPLRLGPARSLVAGYEEERPLSPAERAGLYEELRFAALRFTVTRLTDVHLRAGGRKDAATGAGAPQHTKDYRDYLWRLQALMDLGPAPLQPGLFD